jgi:hypothetical protein
MKRLFQVKNEFFEEKKEAKKFRDANGGVVSKGPDHWRFGIKLSGTTHSNGNVKRKF